MRTSPLELARSWRVSCALIGLCLALSPARGFAAEEISPTPGAVDVFFVLDNSGSMRRNDPDRAMQALVVDFATAMSPGSRLGVVVFDGTARLVAPLDAAVGAGSGPRWSAVLSTIDYTGQWTNSPAGIERALYELKREGRDGVGRSVVFITDGLVDTGDRVRDLEKTRWLKEDLAEEASRAGVRIHGIALAEDADVEIIQALAQRTGGEYWRVPQARDIAGALASTVRATAATPPAVETPLSRPVAPLPVRPPPVSAPRPDATRGVVWLGLGLTVAAAVLAAPLLRRRLRARVRPSFVAPFQTPSGGGSPLLPALPRGGRPPVVQLVDVSDATGRGKPVLLLDAPTTRFGRDPGNDVVIPSDTVSSFHATIDYCDGYFQLEDHRSTNGTWLSGRKLFANRASRLKSGDVIDLAGHEFRFLIPDHEPLGRTLVLDITSLARAREAAVEPPAGSAGPDPVAALVTAFDQCLGGHLSRIAALGDPHRRFVERAFPIEIRALLVRQGQDLIERCHREEQGGRSDLAKAGIRYAICALPLPLDGARSWWIDQHGGYAKFLVGLLDARTSPGPDCEAICVITFGMQHEAWLSITIVPARNDADAIEVMSLEFLTDDERHEAESLEIADVRA